MSNNRTKGYNSNIKEGNNDEENLTNQKGYSLKSNDIFWILKQTELTPELLWALKTYLKNLKFDRWEENKLELIRHSLKEVNMKNWFQRKDICSIIWMIDKLENYYTEYKKLQFEFIDKLKNSTELIDITNRLASIYASRKAEEYLIEMLRIKHDLGSWIGADGLYRLSDCTNIKARNKNLESLKEEYKDKTIKIDVGQQLNMQSRVEKLILDYFWSFEHQSKYLDELEKEYHDNLVKNDELFRKKEKKSYTNLETLEKEMESLKRDRYGIITKMDVAKMWIRDYKNEIYRLVEKFGIILNGDLCSKLRNYPEFSDLLIENNRRLSTTEEAETIEVE